MTTITANPITINDDEYINDRFKQDRLPYSVTDMVTQMEEYGEKLQEQYNRYYERGVTRKWLCTDEIQTILSFAFGETREGDKKYEQDTFNYCHLCKRYKPMKETTNHYCVQYMGSNPSYYYVNWKHEDKSICYDCIKETMEYGITHHNQYRKPRCPICLKRSTYHWIDNDRLYRSHPCRDYLIKSLLNYNGSTTICLKRNEKHKNGLWKTGLHHALYKGADGEDYTINTNSFRYKFNVLYRMIIDRDDYRKLYRGIKNSEKYDKKGYFMMKKAGKKDYRYILDKLKEGISTALTGLRANDRFMYYWDSPTFYTYTHLR